MCLCGCGCSAHEKVDKPFVITPSPVRDVFCNECKHYRDTMMHESDSMKNRCTHPDVFNRSRYEPGTPIAKGYIRKWTYPGNCYTRNANNNCELFKKQEYTDRSEMKS